MRKWLFLAVLAAGIAAGQAGDPEELFRGAVELHAAGKLEQAVERYQAYLRVRPDRVEAISNLGAALARLGRMEDAVEQYKLALSKEPANPGVRLNLALAYYKMLQLREAAAELEQLHAAIPGDLRIAALLGDCYFRQGEWKKVIALLTPVAARNPAERPIAYLLGMALLKDRQILQGQRIIDRFFSSETAEGHMLMGMARFETKDFFGARDEFAKAVKLNPKLPLVWSLYAGALRESEETEAAAKAYRQALVEDPNDFEANLYVGTALRRDQDFDQAIQLLRRALQVRPSDPGVRLQLSQAFLGAGRAEEARRELETLVRDWPDFVEAHVTLATVYYRLDRKADGDRQRAVVQKLNAAAQPKQSGEER